MDNYTYAKDTRTDEEVAKNFTDGKRREKYIAHHMPYTVELQNDDGIPF